MGGIREIPDLPGYGVDRQGGLWSRRNRNGRGVGSEWRRIKGSLDTDGYRVAEIAGRLYKVHRLVLLTFVGPCPPGMETCHRNGRRDDNRLSNLRWDTPVNNQADRARHGRAFTGERNPAAKLTRARAKTVLRLAAKGELTQAEIGRRVGITQGAVSHILRGRTWQGLRSGY